MKLHLCCGDVYLEDYINTDICGEIRPDNPNKTDLKHYYKYMLYSGYQKPIFVDMLMDLTKKWEFNDNSIEEVLMISAIEHFTLDEITHIISEAHRVLKDGMCFKFDFPDILLTLKKNYPHETTSRLIYGTHKNPYSVHKTYLSRPFIVELFYDWSSISFGNVVKHDYPMQGVSIQK